MPMLAELVEVVIGVDTHKHTHTAVLVAASGQRLAEATITADPRGYAELIALAQAHSSVRAWAIEGASSYGSGLAEALEEHHEVVIEIARPKRPARRHGAKSDPIDAERAAREALVRTQLGAPRSGAERAALAALLATRNSAVQASGDAQRQLHALVLTAPEPVAARFRGQSTRQMIRTAAALRPGAHTAQVQVATVMGALKALAARITRLESEATDHQRAITAIVASWRPDLLEVRGVGPIVAATVLTAWSHAGRCRDHGAFAMLAGTAPIPASSGEVVRYRLNRSGDRQLNRAMHTIALTRLRCDPATRAYAEKRRHDGKTKRETRRCLVRYISRQIFRQLENPQPSPTTNNINTGALATP